MASKFDPPPEISEEKNFKNLKSVLVKCAKYENTLNKQNLKFHIHHGKLLDEFHGFWIQERAEGNVTLKWSDWLIQGGPISSLLWATFRNCSSLWVSAG